MTVGILKKNTPTQQRRKEANYYERDAPEPGFRGRGSTERPKLPPATMTTRGFVISVRCAGPSLRDSVKVR
jgi:hypothetical protein